MTAFDAAVAFDAAIPFDGGAAATAHGGGRQGPFYQRPVPTIEQLSEEEDLMLAALTVGVLDRW